MTRLPMRNPPKDYDPQHWKRSGALPADIVAITEGTDEPREVKDLRLAHGETVLRFPWPRTSEEIAGRLEELHFIGWRLWAWTHDTFRGYASHRRSVERPLPDLWAYFWARKQGKTQ